MGTPLYYYYDSIIPIEICECLCKEFDQAKLKKGVVFGNAEQKGKFNYNPDMRDSNVEFFPETHWVTGILKHYAAHANSACWQYPLFSSENVQFTQYKQDQYYHRHTDTYHTHRKITSEHGEELIYNRFVSSVLVLNHSADYEGGNFEIEDSTGRVYTEKAFRNQGTVIVFPSSIKHGVTEVTKGVRQSCVCWTLGSVESDHL